MGQKTEFAALLCSSWVMGRTCSPGGWCSPGRCPGGGSWSLGEGDGTETSRGPFHAAIFPSTISFYCEENKKKIKKKPCVAAIYAGFSYLKITVA